MKNFEQFINESHDEKLDTKKKIEKWLQDNEIFGEIDIDDSLVVNVKGNVSLNDTKFKHIPIKFGKVN